MFDRSGHLWNVGKAVDLQRRLREYRSLWKSTGMPKASSPGRDVLISFVPFPPKDEWPHAIHKKKLYRLEWFIQLALEMPARMNALYRDDPKLFRGRYTVKVIAKAKEGTFSSSFGVELD